MMVLFSDRNGIKSPLDYLLDVVKECSFAYCGNMHFGVCDFFQTCKTHRLNQGLS